MPCIFRRKNGILFLRWRHQLSNLWPLQRVYEPTEAEFHRCRLPPTDPSRVLGLIILWAHLLWSPILRLSALRHHRWKAIRFHDRLQQGPRWRHWSFIVKFLLRIQSAKWKQRCLGRLLMPVQHQAFWNKTRKKNVDAESSRRRSLIPTLAWSIYHPKLICRKKAYLHLSCVLFCFIILLTWNHCLCFRLLPVFDFANKIKPLVNEYVPPSYRLHVHMTHTFIIYLSTPMIVLAFKYVLKPCPF